VRRVAAVVTVVAALVSSACTTADRYELKLGAAQVLAPAGGVRALAVGGRDIVYASANSGVYRVNTVTRAAPVFVSPIQNVTSIAVRRGEPIVASKSGRIVQVTALPPGGERPIWRATSRRSPHVEVGSTGDIYVSLGTRIDRIDAGGRTAPVSDGWVNAFAFDVDDRDRLFVADQAPRGGTAFVARGRESDRAKRRRFATGLPKGSVPSALATRVDELLVCRANAHDVYRLHVGLDNTPRRRGVVRGVACEGAIATMADGSVVTATANDIRRYPPRR